MKKYFLFATVLLSMIACAPKEEKQLTTDYAAPMDLDSNEYWVERYEDHILILPKNIQADTLQP